MSPTLTGTAPLRIPRAAEVVASSRGWHLAVTHHEPDGRAGPKYLLLDRRACLGLLLAVRRAWWRIAFHRAARGASPRARLDGLYVSSGPVEVARDLLGDHVRVLGARLRTGRAVRAFRRGLVESMLLGRRFSAELARNGARLAWPAVRSAAEAVPSRSGGTAARRQRCLLPEPAWARPLALTHRPAAAPAPVGRMLLLTAASKGPDHGPAVAGEAPGVAAREGDRAHAA